MLPFNFEWQWDVGHFIFFGLFYLALTVIGTSLFIASIRTLKDLKNPRDHH